MKDKILKLVWYCHHLGFFTGLRIIFTLFRGKKGQEIAIKVPGIRHPVHIRAKSSDEYTFQQIFINKEYGFSYDAQPSNIIDAGANIGLAAVYFANRFPNSRVFCLEPEPNNFKLLQKNISYYPNIKAIPAGLWGVSTYLRIRDEGLGNWGFIVEETDAAEPGAIKAVSLLDLIKENKLESLDIVKMDIEGSEKEVLEAGDLHEWLSVCKVLIIELHDRMKKGTSAALFRALLQYDVQVELLGENLVCRLNSQKEQKQEKFARMQTS
jgi:FkbM family methyltransferase